MKAEARLRVGVGVQTYSYALELLTIAPTITIRSNMQVGVVVPVPASSVAIAAGISGSSSGSLTMDAALTRITASTPDNVIYADANTVYVVGEGSIAMKTPSIILDSPLLFRFDGANGAAATTSESPWYISPTFHGGAVLTSLTARFGATSLFLDGPQSAAGDWITYTSPVTIGLADFCIEFWVYYSATTTDYSTIYSFGGLNSIDISYTDKVVLLYVDGYGGEYPSCDLQASSWHHVALYRSGGIVRLAVDGILSTVTYAAAIDLQDTQHYLGDWDGTGDYAALGTFIDELRVTYGSSVYGTSDFSPPSAPLEI